MIAHVLALISNKFYGREVDVHKVVTLDVFHEASEVITGDMATSIKYFNPEIKKAYKDIEKVANERLLRMLPKNPGGLCESLEGREEGYKSLCLCKSSR